MTSIDDSRPPVYHPCGGFGPSLLSLLRGAAGDKVDRNIHSKNGRQVDTEDVNEKDESSYTIDLLTSLPDQVKSTSLDDIKDRSRYVVEDVSEKQLMEDEKTSGNSQDEGPLFDDKLDQNQPLSAQDKCNIYKEEFGQSGMSQLLEHEEEYVTDVTAYYVDDVIVKGYALLTTHRFFFLAYLPKKSALAIEKSKDEVILAGPAFFHRPSRRYKKRLWYELKRDTLTGYPSSQRLYEPFGGVRILHIDNLAQLIDGAREVYFHIRGDRCWMEFDTHEAAVVMHRELEGLIWQSKHNVETLRVAVPLLRISSFSTTPFMDFSEVMTFKVDQATHRHEILGKLNTFNIGIHLPLSQAFIVPLRLNLQKMQEWKERNSHHFQRAPLAILDLQDSNMDSSNGVVSHLRHYHHHHDDKNKAVVSVDKEFFLMEFVMDCNVEDMHVFRADVVHGIPQGGHLCLTPDYLCFYSKRVFRSGPGLKTKIPLNHVKEVYPKHAFRWHHYGIRLVIEAHSDVSFELYNQDERDQLESLIKALKLKPEQDEQEKQEEKPLGNFSRLATLLEQDILIPQHVIHKLRNLVNVDVEKHMKLPAMKIACLTIGSRGDVQPYIALCKSLMEHGHQCVIVSHPEYKEWVNKHGVEFRPAGGDPGILMKLSVENKMFSPTFFTETLGKFRQWLDELLREIVEQCYDVELIIESPSTFGGIHAAEVLEIGYMRAFTMPWTKTSAYPQAFSVPAVDLGAGYNLLSYDLYEQVIWMASEGQINRWRRNMLGLANTTLAKLNLDHVPFMYNFSPGVVPPPLDWGNLTTVTGYWNLPSTTEAWSPPADLEAFLNKAKKEGKKVAYVGFGSITLPNAHKTMQIIFDAAQQSGVYCIVSKGWSDRMQDSSVIQKPWIVPENVYLVDSIPHDWLFPRIHIAFHHGGAGTTGASLANKLVTLIHPFFGDQFFWASRVEKLGAGKRVATLNIHDIKSALTHASQDRLMKEKAVRVGEAIKMDHGVESARAFIYRHYKASKRTARRATHTHSNASHSICTSTPKKEATTPVLEKSPTTQRQDSGLALTLVESPAKNQEPEHSATFDSHNSGGYSSKKAKQEDVDRRLALLCKCRIQGRMDLLKLLNPEDVHVE